MRSTAKETLEHMKTYERLRYESIEEEIHAHRMAISVLQRVKQRLYRRAHMRRHAAAFDTAVKL